MGGDGGVKPLSRRDLREAKKPTYIERKNKTEVSLSRYTTCALTNEPLGARVVCCRMGNMFNQVTLMERLQQKTLPERFQHICSLKDMTTLVFTPNPDNKHNSTRKCSDLNYWSPSVRGAFICPVTFQELNGRNRFCAIWKTGIVLSQRCLKEIPHKELFEVAKCDFGPSDIVCLNVPEEETEELVEMKEALVAWQHAREAEKAEKKKRKRAKRKESRKAAKTSDLAIEGQGDKRIKKKKSKKHRKARQASDLTAIMQSAGSMTKEAADKVAKECKANALYASLFVKDPSRLVNLKDGGNEKNNLFCRMATHRYLT